MRCKQTCTSSNKKCRRQAQNGSNFCWQHQKTLIGGADDPTKFSKPKKGQWDIYGKGYCPHTQNALIYAHSKFSEPICFYDITTFNPPMNTMQLKRKLGGARVVGDHSTVPMIFDIKNEFIGGAAELRNIY